MSKFDWALSREEKDEIVNSAHDRDGAPCLYELADRVEQAALAKLAEQEPVGYLHANDLCYIDAKSGTKEELYAYDYTIPLYAAPVPQKHTEQPLEMVPEGWQLVPKEPTEEMHHAARDWSVEKYGKAIGSEASHGCYKAMLAAASKHKGSNDD